MKTPSDQLVKISMSKIPVDQPLELGDDVKLFIQGNITKLSHEDNQDGTYDQVYIVKGIIAEVLGD
jgi:hypothetical protein